MAGCLGPNNPTIYKKLSGNESLESDGSFQTNLVKVMAMGMSEKVCLGKKDLGKKELNEKVKKQSY